MTKRERYEKVMDFFRNEMPEANTELEFGSIFQLLVAVVLSAQCTDKRVNQVTPQLFARYPDAKAMAAAEPEELLDYISSVSYPNAKAKHLAGLARTLVERHNGEVPEDMNALLDLPGVGRKTANVIQAVAFGKSTMAVDTHVYRVSHRLGLVAKSDTIESGTGTDEKHTTGRHPPGPPLATAARQIRLHIAQATLRQMRTRGHLPEDNGRGKTGLGRIPPNGPGARSRAALCSQMAGRPSFLIHSFVFFCVFD